MPIHPGQDHVRGMPAAAVQRRSDVAVSVEDREAVAHELTESRVRSAAPARTRTSSACRACRRRAPRPRRLRALRSTCRSILRPAPRFQVAEVHDDLPGLRKEGIYAARAGPGRDRPPQGRPREACPSTAVGRAFPSTAGNACSRAARDRSSRRPTPCRHSNKRRNRPRDRSDTRGG